VQLGSWRVRQEEVEEEEETPQLLLQEAARP
jgi:hypothetical protein